MAHLPNGKPEPALRKALVTGGTTGLGESIALQLQADGYQVAVCGRRVDKLAAMQARGIQAIVCDVGDMDQVSQMGRAVAGQWTQLDLLVNCAGVVLARSDFSEVSLADVERVLRVNLLGTIAVTQVMQPLVIAAKGSIVNISSTLAQRPRAGSVVYSASKGGVEAFSRAIAVELARHSVRVNCVAPGLVRSDIYLAAGMPAGAYDEMLRARASEIPLKRVGEPVDVAGLVAYLGSEAASWMTGVCIPLDGGGMLR